MMYSFRVGDVVARKSYGGDLDFRIVQIADRNDGKKVYVLKGLLYRIEADSLEDDLVIRDMKQTKRELARTLKEHSAQAPSQSLPIPMRLFSRARGTAGRILHIDSSEDYLEMCMKLYRQSGIKAYGRVISESEQPKYIRRLLESTKADILIATGHDGVKKNATNLNSIDSYRNSRYYIASVKEARLYEPSPDKLCVFSGACQSYYEAIMAAGANFASSPGRILIHALDPAKVGDRVALTDSRSYVTAEKLAQITKSGMEGIGGQRTRGHYIVQ